MGPKHLLGVQYSFDLAILSYGYRRCKPAFTILSSVTKYLKDNNIVRDSTH